MVQNWLKHSRFEGSEIESMRITEFVAVIALQRAISKFVAVYHGETPEMAKFMVWCRDHDYPAPRKRARKKRPQLRLVQ
jgi:hypothetical protein